MNELEKNSLDILLARENTVAGSFPYTRIACRELIEFLQALIRVPSVNPPGGEGPVAELIARKLHSLGFEVSVFESEPGRPNVLARLPGTLGNKTLLLNGHMDVQPPVNGSRFDPFAAVIEGNLLYGRGASDMKAGLAAAVFAADALVRAGVRLSGDLVIAAVADEVCGGHKGTGFLARKNLLRADYAIVCEPTGEQVNVAHRGAIWLEIEIVGKSAHGGRPWLGINAVSKMAKVISALERNLVPRLAARHHPMLPSPTINLGAVQGGIKFNLVADRCVLQIDRRTIPGEDPETCLNEIADICAEVQRDDADKFEFRLREVMRVSPAEIAPDSPIVWECRKAFREITGREADIGCTAGFEDAHFLLSAGILTAMFGPYRSRTLTQGAKFFSPSGMADEFVELPEVFSAARIYARLIHNILA